MLDNINLITPLLNFSDPGDFYMLYVFKRKKDQPVDERDNHQSVRTIKSYTISSIDYLNKRYPEIKELCEMFKARAYIHIQKQNHRDVSLNMMVALAERIQSGNHDQRGLFDSVVGQMKTYEKRWIVDIDNKDENFAREIQEFINTQCRPFGMKIEANIPTKNGHHLITTRFDVKTFSDKYPEIDVQKKNPTLIYLPNSLTD
jgi:hypothetical protein